MKKIGEGRAQEGDRKAEGRSRFQTGEKGGRQRVQGGRALSVASGRQSVVSG